MVKVFIDPGHGGTDPGAVANGLLEKDITLAIARSLQTALLNQFLNVETRLARTGDQTVSLAERTRAANQWQADFYISVHVNAGGGNGFESYIWNGNFTNKQRTRQIRSAVHQAITSELALRNRGEKEANFHVLRETRMAAVLTENGFIDHHDEAHLMRQVNWIDRVAQAHALGIADAFNLRPKVENVEPSQLYRVVVGAFTDEANARARIQELKEKGYESYLLPYENQEQLFFRVIAGAFRQRENALTQQNKLKNEGFESFILAI
ncbi:N-acetylmuramoyl-L-alanine amidase [Amphibacillus marinus]|uniref:N-acetylmuramoyl-L-alanine amidase n=1 Tax=Amphibacillus marinus TaxID=872970 RepID=A0A1H8GZ12_9BACI|nr:N-acetylmuramoyl-L-alanine amidase [Amphibacillus marinus]SEN48999.1 N-acetylmuramoyl-L-alanine amidase [Amphibacillus marinus]